MCPIQYSRICGESSTGHPNSWHGILQFHKIPTEDVKLTFSITVDSVPVQTYCRLILPLMQSYAKAGEFTVRGKLKSALVDNAIYYGSYLFICGVLLIYIAVKPGLQLDGWVLGQNCHLLSMWHRWSQCSYHARCRSMTFATSKNCVSDVQAET